MAKRLAAVVVHLLFLVLLAACGGSEASSVETLSQSEIDAALAAAPPATVDAATGPVDFSAADLDLYEKGFAQELAIVKAAKVREANASTPGARAEAAQAAWEDKSIPAAARAAGVSEERYRLTRAAVHDVFETLDFQGTIDGPLSMDLSVASDAMKETLLGDPFDALTPGAAAALRARMDRLVPGWIEYVRLTAVAG